MRVSEGKVQMIANWLRVLPVKQLVSHACWGSHRPRSALKRAARSGRYRRKSTLSIGKLLALRLVSRNAIDDGEQDFNVLDLTRIDRMQVLG